MSSQAAATPGTHVLIIGAGFGGIEAAKALAREDVSTTIVDRQNHHLFQPLLYQVATAALSPADIAEPIRRILSGHPSVEVILGEAASIDVADRSVALRDGRILPYDRLILAAGASYGYFGHGEWVAVAPGLKTIEDARTIRSRLLLTFELAEMAADPDEQQRLMTIAIIGGGPTGVEMAGSIAELCRYALARDFRRIRPASARILLIEAGPRILSAFPESLAAFAMRRLARLGVDVRLNQPVESIRADAVVTGGAAIPVGLTIWSAGVVPSPLGRLLPAERDRAGRILVNPDLSVPGLEGVFAIGDLAHAAGADGAPLPGLAQVAKQQGIHLGRGLAANIRRGEALRPFVFRNRGNTAIVGRHAAVFDFGRWRLKGTLAWFLWALVHVYLLVGFQHRLTVSLQWLWRYLTYERGARLIVPAPSAPEPPAEACRRGH